MKTLKWLIPVVVVVAAIVLVVIYLNPIKAAMNKSDMKDFVFRPGTSYERIDNKGIIGMWKMGSSGVPFLVKYIEDKNDNVRLGSAIVLGMLNSTEEGDNALFEALKRAGKPEVTAVIWALSKRGKEKTKRGKELTKKVSGILKTGKKEGARLAAAKILGKIKDKKTGKALVAALSDKSFAVAFSAAYSLQLMSYGEATHELIKLTRRMAAQNKTDEAKKVCTILLGCVSAVDAKHVFSELGEQDFPPLLEACRQYSIKLATDVVMPYLMASAKSSNPIERESVIVIADKLLPAEREQVAILILSGSDRENMFKGLKMLYEIGSPACRNTLMELAESSDKEIASKALLALGRVIEKNKEFFGRPPELGRRGKPISRELYVEFVLDKLQDPDLRRAASKSLEKITARTIGTSYEDWKSWWDSFKSSSYFIRDLSATLKALDDIDLGNNKTIKNFNKAKALLAKAEDLVNKLEALNLTKESVVDWIAKQREKVNIYKYSIDKYKPLDIMN